MHKPDPPDAALNIWFAGLVLGPIYFFFIEYLSGRISGNTTWIEAGSNFLDTYLLMLTLGAILSFPSAVVLWLALSIQYRFRQSALAFWSTIMSVSLTLTVVPFASIPGVQLAEDNGLIRMTFAYLIGIWTGVYRTFRHARFDEPEEPLETGF